MSIPGSSPPAAHMKTARACERCFYLLMDANFKRVEVAGVRVHTETVSQRQTALFWLLELWILMFLALRSHHRPDYSAPALVPRLHEMRLATVW